MWYLSSALFERVSKGVVMLVRCGLDYFFWVGFMDKKWKGASEVGVCPSLSSLTVALRLVCVYGSLKRSAVLGVAAT